MTVAEEMFTAPELSEQEQIRRAKLEKYQTEGRDPYTITRYDRTHTSRQILEGLRRSRDRRFPSPAA